MSSENIQLEENKRINPTESHSSIYHSMLFPFKNTQAKTKKTKEKQTKKRTENEECVRRSVRADKKSFIRGVWMRKKNEKRCSLNLQLYLKSIGRKHLIGSRYVSEQKKKELRQIDWFLFGFLCSKREWY